MSAGEFLSNKGFLHSTCGNYDWKRKGAGRHNAEKEGGCTLCAGDKVERKQGEGH